MEQLTVTLETATKLTNAGFPPKTYYYWLASTNPDNGLRTRPWRLAPLASYQSRINDINRGECDVHAAPTAQEIADQLPGASFIQKCAIGDGYHVTSGSRDVGEITADTMAEALAALYIKLKEAK